MIDDFRPGIQIREEDGAPVGRPRILKVPNTALTDNGDGTFSLSLISIGDLRYLKLDASNDPLTDELVITPATGTNALKANADIRLKSGSKLIFDSD